MRPLILITNDDGVRSPGLHAATEVAMQYADVLISAPIEQQSGMGRSFLRTEDQGIIETVDLDINGERHRAYGVHGSPAFSVAHGVMELAGRKPDLCISGINYGENVGMVLTCSGTFGAALEAVSHGIPAIAVSLEADLEVQRDNNYPKISWEMSKKVLDKWVRKALEGGMPSGTDIWNINIPLGMKDEEAYRITRQSKQNYFVFQKPEPRELTKPFKLQSALQVDLTTLEENSDIEAVYVDRITSVTPITWDMTAKSEVL